MAAVNIDYLANAAGGIELLTYYTTKEGDTALQLASKQNTQRGSDIADHISKTLGSTKTSTNMHKPIKASVLRPPQSLNPSRQNPSSNPSKKSSAPPSTPTPHVDR